MEQRRPKPDEIRQWLVSRIADMLDMPPAEIEPSQPFSELGLTSADAVGLSGELEEWLGARFAPTLLYDHPTIEALSRAIGGEPEEPVVLSREVGSAKDDQIAIIGLGCRFPGAPDLAAFWRLLLGGVDAIREVPPERWDLRALYDPDPAAPGKMSTRWGGFLDRVDGFEPAFFGISPQEAERMDPQQRLLLEVVWEALEDAGIVPGRLAGTRTGVFVGISTHDYSRFQFSDPALVDALGGTGNATSIAANRISYWLGLEGPSLAVDTACSSSLVALHLACQSLRGGDCELALVGGVNVILSPELTIIFSKAGLMAPDGRCKVFDSRADGYVRSEGAGMAVLKPLARAKADGDPIWAVIRASAVNQDGRTNGLMAPNALAQEAVLREAYRRAGVAPAEVGYVETHGTGTPLGDRIEAGALGAVVGAGRPAPCPIGSVKSNLGHLEAAAGMAGLIKAALALRHRQIPPSLHYQKPNPHLDFGELGLAVVHQPTPWPEDRTLAGVSAFGFGGTNAHVVLEAAAPPIPEPAARAQQLLVLSARTATALEQASKNLAACLDESPALSDVAFTLQQGRSAFEHRRALVAATPEEVRERLAELDPAQVATGRHKGAACEEVVFLFPGLGELGAGMAAELYRSEEVFRQVVDHCAEILAPHLGEDLRALLFAADAPKTTAGPDLRALLGRGGSAPAGKLAETRYAHPATFTIEIALARLLESWGIRPRALLGYSLGEYVAACLAGVLSLEDALELVAVRARLIHELPAGAMLAVPVSEETARRLITETEVELAAVNTPELVIVAGPVEAVETLEKRLAEEEILSQRIRSGHAFHTAMMAPVAEELTRRVAALELRPPRIPYLSNVTGGWITDAEATDAGYWARHLCSTVRFESALAELLSDGERVFVEVGPGQSLTTALKQHPAWQQQTAVGTLPLAHLRAGELEHLLGALGRLWVAGVVPDWSGLHGAARPRRISLPTYPFERERHWLGPEGGLSFERSAPAVDLAGALARLHRAAEVERWIYAPSWEPAPLTAASPDARPGRSWWVFVPQPCPPRVEQLIGRLEARGERVRRIEPGGFAAGELPERILHLGSLGSEALEETLDRGFYSLVALAQTLGPRLSAGSKLVLDVVTSGENPARATVTGAVKVIPLEYPAIVCRHLDLEPVSLEGLLAALDAPVEATEIALRGGERLIRRFETRLLPTAPVSPWRPDGVYLITGGRGGIGLALAEHLARRVPGVKLVLVGRSEPSHDERLESLGAVVVLERADVADREQMRGVIERTRERFGALHGVFHAAGVPGAGLMQHKSRADLAKVLAPKVQGTLVLDELLEGSDTELLVLFSSIVSIAGGGPGQVDYCAANAFLDAYAAAASSPARRVVSISWAEWRWNAWESSLDGLPPALRVLLVANRERLGIDVAAGMDALERILAAEGAHFVVSPADLASLIEIGRKFTVERLLAPAIQTALAELGPTAAAPALGELERRIVELWRRVLPVSEIGLRDNFFDLGGSSLTAMQVTSELGRLLGREIPPVTLFEAPTVRALAALLQPGVATPSEAIPQSEVVRLELLGERRRRRGAGEGIAIIGMAGRFPGAAGVETLWRNLLAGRETVTFFSDDELRAAGVDPVLLANPRYVKAGSVLDEIERFDAELFGYPPREAELMDPQHRLFLECAWEALDDAGYDPERYPGAIGIFGGANLSTYLFQLAAQPELAATADPFLLGLGNSADSLTTRVSYKLDLRGPSVAVQTFCSTSAVATHMACESLLRGECDMALAGGVRIAVPHRTGYLYQPGGIDSPDGHTRTFDAKAGGAVLGNGVALLLLKPLSAALADGDHVYAVIRGSAINNDGSAKVGYTAPSVGALAEAMAEAFERSGVDPATISYVEAHGTATELGDPIEVAALTKAFRRHTAANGDVKKQWCAIGSVKTNFGHLDRAAGATALIKTALALDRGELPPSLHFETPNPALELAESPFFVQTARASWPRGGRPRRAAVNALGIGGTNVHFVLEEAPAQGAPAPSRPWQLLVLAANTETALETMSNRLARHLETHPELALADVAATLQQGRRVLAHRRAVVCRDLADAVRVLDSRDPQRVSSHVESALERPVVFLFPGLGDHYVHMAQGLYDSEPTFRAVVDRCAELLQEPLGLDLREILFPAQQAAAQEGESIDLRKLLRRGAETGASRLDETWLAQPAVFVIELALARQLIEWGLRPSAMVGYSLGEYVAATVAGVLTLEDAVRVVAWRAKAIHALEAGAMLAVPMAEQEARELLGEELSLAAVNSPQLSVLAGPVAAIDALEARLGESDVSCLRLRTSHAFHSTMMTPMVDAFAEFLRGVELRAPRIPYLSNVTGTWITPEDVADPGYWVRHLVGTVRFGDALTELLSERERVLVEVGPGQSLGAAVKQHPSWQEQPVVPVLRALHVRSDDPAYLLAGLGKLWLAGAQVDWHGFYRHEQRRRVSLPSYPFEGERFWIGRRGASLAQTAVATAKKPDAADWFYRAAWQPAPLPETPETKPEKWLLLGDGGELAEALRQRGQTVEIAAPDADLVPVLRASDPDRIVHLVSLGGGERSFDQHQEAGLYGLLRLARALGETHRSRPLRLDVVSDQLHEVTAGESFEPAKATLAAICKVLPQELPSLSCRLIDTDGSADLAAELVQGAPIDLEIAWRGGERFGRGYQPVRLEVGELPLRERGVYLITGGLGGVALVLAEELARRCSARLALLGRSVSPERLRKVEALEALGAEVLVLSADVADPVQLEAAIQTVEARFGALDGVLHAAGVSGRDAFALAQQAGPELCELHFRPKIRGVLALAAALESRSPDFVVLFSSLSAVLGGIGFGPYAAANAFLSSFARQKNQQGGATRWLAVEWDAWLVAAVNEMTAMGLDATVLPFAMSPDEGRDAFLRVLASRGEPVLIHSTGELSARVEQWLTRMALPKPAAAERSRYSRPKLGTAFVAADGATERKIAAVFEDVLGIDGVGLHDNYFDLGGTSLTAIQVVGELQKLFDAEITPVTLFEAPSVAELARLLAPAAGAERQDRLAAAVAARPVLAASSEAIAIIGLGGRFPGAHDVEALWRNLEAGAEALTFFTDAELTAAGVSPEKWRDPDYVRARPILQDVDLFDAEFFGYSPREAELMDPQMRVFLEAAWEALESSGYASEEGRGKVAVFAGSNISTYLLGMLRDPAFLEGVGELEAVITNDRDSLATSVSYKFNLRGPSLSVQTFCSTSAVATHLACQSLLTGECDLALAGGVSVRVPVKAGYLYRVGDQYSPDAHTRTFDHRARGTVFGDGAAVVMLKRLSDALRDGDNVRAVIRGSALNNDGSLKVGYTAPSVEGQAEVVALALRNAGVEAGQLSYVEAHGTATALGDPIEVASLTRAFRLQTQERGFCAIGSVKSNVGHLDRAAGATSLIKTVLALEHELIPPTLGYERPNPEIDFARSPFYVAAQPIPWPQGATPRRAGVNSLGVGGTNVHVVVEEAPARAPSGPGRECQLLLLSARTAAALDATTARLASHLRAHPEQSLADVAFTLHVGRKPFAHRRMLVCADRDEAIAALEARQGLSAIIEPGARSAASLDEVLAALPADAGRVLVEITPDANLRMQLETLGRLWLAGVAIDPAVLWADQDRRRVVLPTYPFERRSFWVGGGRPSEKLGSPAIGLETLDTLERASDLAQWFYLPVWKPTPLPVRPARAPGVCWVFADEHPFADALLARLAARGETVVRLTTDSLDPSRREDWERLVDDAAAEGELPARVLHLWHLGLEEKSLERTLDLGFHALIYLAHALGRRHADPLEITIVAQGTHQVAATDALHPARATIMGPVLLLPVEHTHIAVRHLDCDRTDPELVEPVVAELFSPIEDNVIAWRDGERLVRAWEQHPIAPAPATTLRRGGVYLITGGFGGIGLALAEHLASAHDAKLALLGRGTQRAPSQLERLAALEARGTEVLELQADVADPEQVRAALARLWERFGALDGVFHVAGVPASGLMQHKSAADFARVMAPKIQGTLALDRALRELPVAEPPLVVLFSSITAMTGGGPGQVDYCAANAFLDAWAQEAARQGRPVHAIAWGEWQWNAWEESQRGLPPAVLEQFRKTRERLGIDFEGGMEALERALAAGLVTCVVSPPDFTRMMALARGYTVDSLLAPAAPAPSAPLLAAVGGGNLAGVALERRITEIWQRVLGVAKIGASDNFFDLGGNSLVGLQVTTELGKELGQEVLPVALYEAPTVRELARLLRPESIDSDAMVRQVAGERRRERRGKGLGLGESASSIAIIGVAGRFPGAADVEQMWQNLVDGRETVTFFTDEELLAAGVERATLENPHYVKAGSVLDDVDRFDAGLFGYPPREAELMDPQQRLFLECAWETLDDAGYDPLRYPGSIGVFGGANLSTYLLQLVAQPELAGSLHPLHVGLGNAADSLTTRVSYKLNLRGPSVAVQTFCSTSAVAAHMACESLLRGECDMALAGGVRVAVPHRTGYFFEPGSIDSPDGHTRTFDAKAGGAVVGNGVALVLLKPLADALADGDHVYAVIRGSAINNDGAGKVGYTAPSVGALSEAMTEALERAGVEPATIAYVEAHGTATALGDQIEIAALTKAYRRAGDANREAKEWCAIGSVKTNFGHLDRAAGATALIKTALALDRGVLPPSLHFETPNPELDLPNSPFFVQTERREWRRGGKPRRAAVNALGIGGTNVHFVLEEAPLPPSPSPSRPWQLLVLAANTETALETMTDRLARHLRARPELALADVAATLQTGRRVLPHRRTVVCRDPGDAVRALESRDPQRLLSHAHDGGERPVVFLFPGLGDHYVHMAQGLYDSEPSFRALVDRCCELLEEPLGLDLRAILFPAREPSQDEDGKIDLRQLLRRGSETGASRLDETWLAQPAVFVIELALAQQLIEWGLRPSAMVGYSLGEYVAATVAGVLTLEDAVRVVAWRAKAIHALEAGAMLAVPMPESQARELLGAESSGRALSLAAVNSPQLSVLAGPIAAIDALEARLGAQGVSCLRLRTSHAFHSTMMTPMVEAFADFLRGVELRAPQVPYLSNVTGTWITPEDVADPGYWVRHLCGTVRFGDALTELLSERERVLIEVGPGQSLGAAVKQHPSWREQPVVPVLRALHVRDDDTAYLLGGLGKLWLAGAEVDWQGFYRHEQRRRVALPSYPFEGERYWVGKRVGAIGVKALPAAGKKADPADWYYRAGWKPAALPDAASAKPETWLLLGEGAALAEQLRRQGQTVEIAAPGADWAERLRSVDPDRVVHLESLGSAASFEEHQERGLYSLLRLAHALGEAHRTRPLRLEVVSDGIFEVVAGESFEPAKATLVGACKVLPQEAPSLSCRLIETDAAADFGVDLASELLHGAASDLEVAWRGGERFVRSFEPVRLEMGETPLRGTPLRERGVYLITGGLGEVGMVLAEELARGFQARLALLGRSARPERSAKVAALEALGAEVLVLSADVADPAQLRAAIETTETRFGALHGVLHAAGIGGRDAFAVAQHTDRELCERHFRPKIRGALNLASALEGRELDFVLLFSSLSAVLGGLGFTAYTAANLFLSNFARHQARGGTRWLAIEWDSWALEGAREALEMGLEKTLIELAMSPAEGQDAFRRVLASAHEPVLVHSTGDLSARVEQWLVGMAAPKAASTAPRSRYARPHLGTAFVAAEGASERQIAEVFEDVLGIDGVGLNDNFFDLGGTSLTAIQVVGELQKRFDAEITPVTLFEAPSVAELARQLGPAVGGEREDRVAAALAALPAPITTGEAVAIIGMAGRFPGARDIEQLWRNLEGGVESLTFFTPEELAASGLDPALIADPAYVAARPILDEIDRFDAAFFGYTPREAELMDPQLRIFLETAWEALESAGYGAPRWGRAGDRSGERASERGRVGVFTGSNISTYLLGLIQDPVIRAGVDDFEAVIANDRDALATSVSYKLDLKGPSLTVQTFCSTSAVATHLARRSLLDGECDLALAGGVSVRVPSKMGHLYRVGDQGSPDGHTRTFDHQARGTVFGDGSAVVVLKRLSEALRDGDQIHAVIRGSALNNDGSLKVGYTAPSVEGQAEVVATALRDAGVAASEISYVEAHGTATPLGDPIEVASLTRAFRLHTQERGFCALGSVKSNVGHLDRAAGVTSLIKTALALEHRQIPPSLHYERPNPEIDFARSPFFVAAELRPWPRNGNLLRAGVNSLGVGGTNVHVVLEEAPERAPSGPSRPFQLLLLSARSAEALEVATANLARRLESAPELSLADVAFTLQVGRRAFNHRRMIVAQEHQEALTALGSPRPALVAEAGARQVAFLFPGIGEQWVGMARGLYDAEPVFRRELERCAAILAEQGAEVDLLGVLYPQGMSHTTEAAGGVDLRRMLGRAKAPVEDEHSRRLGEIRNLHPALFALEYALAQLLISWGLAPRAMLGYSLGEYVAACLAGVFSLEDGLRLVAARGRWIDELPEGAMLAVPLAPEELGLDRLEIDGFEIDVAAYNGAGGCVVSGPVAAIAALEQRLSEREVVSRRLRSTRAFHSRQLDPVAPRVAAMLATLELHPPAIPFVSNVSGTWITAAEATDPEYWARHLCRPVRFADGVAALLAEPGRVLVEVGPGQGLTSFVRLHPACDAARAPRVRPAMRTAFETRADHAVLLESLGALWCAGVEIDWSAFYQDEQRHRVRLPTYPFERRSFWLEPARTPAVTAKKKVESLEDLHREPEIGKWFYQERWKQSPLRLGAPVLGAGAESAERRPWLALVDPESDFLERLLDRLEARGEEVVRVEPGPAFARREGFEQRVAELADQGRLPRRVIVAWDFRAPTAWDEELSDDAQDRAFELGFCALIHLGRALGRHTGGEKILLNVLSRGVHAVSGEETLRPLRASILGPVKLLPVEYTGLDCRHLDLTLPRPGSALEAKLLDRLVEELAAPIDDPAAEETVAETLVAYRGAQRFTRAWEPFEVPRPAVIPGLHRGGVYLVTGGLGGLGLALAEHLAERWEARLVLVGRGGLPPREEWAQILASGDPAVGTAYKIARIQALETRGTEFLSLQADVADRAQMGAVVQLARDRFGVLDGVFHVAGVPGIGLMEHKSPADFARVLAPKLRGALVLAETLHENAAGLGRAPFLALYSSLNAASGGGPGQVDYCAANNFLDAFAQAATTPELPVVAIGWGEWRWNAWEEGMAGLPPEAQEYFRYTRERLGIDFESGMDALERALGSGCAQLVVSPPDYAAMVAMSRGYTIDILLGQAVQASQRALTRGVTLGEAKLHERPALDTAFEPPAGAAEQTVAEVWQRALGIAPIGACDNFFDLGGNSLVGLRVTTELQKELGRPVAPTALHEAPTVRDLARALAQESAAPTDEPALVPVPRDGILPLSFAQQRLWFLELLESETAMHNESSALHVRGRLDRALLAATVRAIEDRHEVLRTAFRRGENGEPELVISPPGAPARPLPEIDLARLAEPARRAELERIGFATARHPFDLARGPLLRLYLTRLAEEEWQLLFVIHHIAFDGWSGTLLDQEVEAFYHAGLAGRSPRLPALPVQYADYAVWQRQRLAGVIETQLEERARQLAGVPTLVSWRGVRRPPRQTFRASMLERALPNEVVERLVAIGRRHQATPFMTFFAVTGVLLRFLTDADDVLVATAVANRDRPEIEHLMGIFANLLVVRLALGDDPDFGTLIERTRRSVLDALAAPELPYERLVERLGPARDPSCNLLVQALFSWEQAPARALEGEGLTMTRVQLAHGFSPYDFDLNLVTGERGLRAELTWASDVFEPGGGKRLLDQLDWVLRALADGPERRLGELCAALAENEEAARRQLARELGSGSRQKLQSIARRGRGVRVAAGGDEEP